jgi:fatty acid desaturase
MWAYFYRRERQDARPRRKGMTMGKSNLVRRGHRAVAILFTLLVALYFAAMVFGLPPAWITYAPLLPLLLLMLTGLVMLIEHYGPVRRAKSGT